MDNNYRHIVLQFDQAQQPKFSEKKGKGYVEFGEYNNYPRYLLDLYNESPKHGAIIKSKCTYIYGKGFEDGGSANSIGESFNNLLKKCIKDDELYRGYYLQIIWNRAKQISEIYHLEFQKVRASKDLTKFFVKNDWNDSREKAREYDAFNINNPYGSQVFYQKEYNPFSEVYPLPSYFQGLNYIESDIEVSRHILGNAKQGFVGSTLINLNNGMPVGEEYKGEVEKGLLKKFTGSEGKRVVIMFNSSKDNAADIQNLGNTMLTKEDFTNINNLIQQEIFASHQVTSPTLFGIKTEGQLGGRNEIRDAYEIFVNTYVNERQQELEIIFTKFRNLKGEIGEFKIVPVEPLKFEFSESIISANLTKDEIRGLMGKEPLEANITNSANSVVDGINSLSPLVATKVLDTMLPNEIRSLAGLPNAVIPNASGITSIPQSANPTQMESNDNIRNLTGRQYQNVMRIVRHFGTGKLNKLQATLMLKSGFGFSDNDVNTFLGIDEDPMTDDEVQKFNDQEEQRIMNEFGACGEDFAQWEVLNRYSCNFADNPILYQIEANVLEIISKNKNIIPEDIAKALDKPVSDINDALKSLEDKNIIKTTEKSIGTDVIIEREILKPLSETSGKNPNIVETFVRYTYEWRAIATNHDLSKSRPFCKFMVGVSASSKDGKQGRTWSMTDIQNMSVRLGYSVLDRCGGWWYHNGESDYQCRHEWVANIVTKKK